MMHGRRLLVVLTLVTLVTFSQSAHSDDAFSAGSNGYDSEQVVRRAEIVKSIDEQLQARWQREGITPAVLATDGEFLRRASLDLNGVIPRVSEVRSFLADDSSDKRLRLVERLLDKPRYATHMATVWCNRILPAGAEAMHEREALGLQKWLRSNFARNLRYDGLVAGMLLTSGSEELGPALYFQANDLAPEKLAASVSELFLGVQLQCAQCHDHPFAEYSQKDFWGLAAFFAQVQRPDGNEMNMAFRLRDTNRGEVRLPDSDEVVPPKYLRDEREVDVSFGSRRASLVLWLTSRDNRQFARAGVNWVWTHLLGTPLVDSQGEIAQHDNSLNGQLLDELAEYFIVSGFDLRELIVTIASTRAYQLSSWQNLPAESPPDVFAYMVPRPLSPEQFYDSFLLLAPRNTASIIPESISTTPVALGLVDDPDRIQFVRSMREPPGPSTEYRSGTLQVLRLMNGDVTAQLTDQQRSRLLGALSAPFLNEEDRIDTLFLATLCRHPDEEELQLVQTAVSAATTDDERNRIFSDLAWALVNSTEFAFNR